MARSTAAEETPAPSPVSRRNPLVRLLVQGVSIVVAGLLLLAAYLVLAPAPIDPVAYEPAPAPAMSGSFAPNQTLVQADILGAGRFSGPEDVDVDAQGRVYGGCMDGKIVRLLPDGESETFADTGGRPLGMDFDPQGNLIVADSQKGLLSVDPHGHVEVLCTSAEGGDFQFADDVDVARDGTIYFSDASSKYGTHDYMLDMLEGRPYGRLLRYDPGSKQVSVLLTGLYFANGVALSRDEDFILVNETWRYRITRYWLRGSKAGQSEIFLDNLPGFPDGVSANGQGMFWLALFTVRNPTADQIAPLPWAKRMLAKLPEWMWPRPQPYAFVLGIDEAGQVVHNLQDPTGKHLTEITSVEEHEGKLYLGSLTNDRVGRIAVPPAPVSPLAADAG